MRLGKIGVLTPSCPHESRYPLFLHTVFFFFFFLALLGLHCFVAFSSCNEQGQLFVGVHGLLIAVASLVMEHGL